MTELALECEDGEIRVDIRVAPRSSRDAVLGIHDGAIKIALTSPPVDGAANAALVAFLAKRLGIPKRAVRIVRGETSRNKRLALRDVTEGEVRALVD